MIKQSDCQHFWSANEGVQECLHCHTERPAPPKSTGEEYIRQLTSLHSISENDLMNTLQDFGVISDNCVALRDVAELDLLRAGEFLARDAARVGSVNL